MISLPAAYGLLGQALVCGALAALPGFGIFRARIALAATAVSLLVGIAPIMLAVLGPPSITLLGLALCHLAGRLPAGGATKPALLIAGSGGALALAAAGWLPGDLYALGYQPWPLLAALLPLGLVLAWQGRTAWLLILAAALFAYAGGLFANLWGALLDPLLIMLAGGALLRAGLFRRRRKS